MDDKHRDTVAGISWLVFKVIIYPNTALICSLAPQNTTVSSFMTELSDMIRGVRKKGQEEQDRAWVCLQNVEYERL